MVLRERIGDYYSHTIKITGSKNFVEVHKNGQERFNGIATHIIDTYDTLSFKDLNGKEYKFVKFIECTWA